MIVLYVNDSRIQLVIASVKGSKIRVKSLREVTISDSIVDDVCSITAMIKSKDKSKIHLIVDSADVKSRDVAMPCLPEAALRKIVETQGVQSGRALYNAVDTVLEVVGNKHRTDVATTGHLNIVPAELMLNVERIINGCGIKVASINIAQLATDSLYKMYRHKLYADQAILINYKDTFAGVSIYDRGVSVRHDNYKCESGENGGLFPIINMSHRAAVIAADDHKLHIEKTYLTGKFDDVMKFLDKVTTEVGIDTELLPMPEDIKGVTVGEFNNYIHAISGLVLVGQD